MVDLEDQYPDDQIEEGKRIMVSPITGIEYRVTRWVAKPDGRAIALDKEAIEDGE